MMLRSFRSLCLVAPAAFLATAFTPARAETLTQFVTREGDRFVEGSREFRYVSVNMPDSFQLITNYRFDTEQPAGRYRLPNEFELRDCVHSVRQLGGRVIRTFVITCGPEPHPALAFDVSRLPVVPNESALQVLDRLLQICHEEGVRLIVPLVAYNSNVRGDVTTYGADFWNVGSPGNLAFKDMLRQLLTRTNAFTGRRYLDDPAILAWQTGNELVIGDDPARRAWLRDIAAYIKSIDPRHLLIDGRNKPNDVFDRYEEFADDPNIDAVSYHTYVNLPQADTPAGTLRLIRNQLRGRKPLLVTEVAMYTKPAALRALLDEVIADGTVGANWWALRFRNRDGGFYKHSDRNSQFEDLNWPGFADPENYLPEIAREREVLGILRDYASRITDTPAPAVEIPDAPRLLPAADVGHLTWQGSTGATDYDVQRAMTADGPWTTLARGVQDHLIVYAPLFCDTTAEVGRTYFYRVLARNSAGTSQPSNTLGPLTPDRCWLVDELFDGGQLAPDSKNVRIEKAYAHSAYLEDIALAGREDPAQLASLVYRVPGALREITFNVFAATIPPRVFLHDAHGARMELKPNVTAYDKGRRARFQLALDEPRTGSVEIELSADADAAQAIGRVELAYLP